MLEVGSVLNPLLKVIFSKVQITDTWRTTAGSKLMGSTYWKNFQLFFRYFVTSLQLFSVAHPVA